MDRDASRYGSTTLSSTIARENRAVGLYAMRTVAAFKPAGLGTPQTDIRMLFGHNCEFATAVNNRFVDHYDIATITPELRSSIW